MLNTLCGERRNIVVFGEMYGPGVQDMDYGIPAGDDGLPRLRHYATTATISTGTS